MKEKTLLFVFVLIIFIVQFMGPVFAQVPDTDSAIPNESAWDSPTTQNRQTPRPSRVGGQQGARRPQRANRANEPETLLLTPEQEAETIAYVEKVQPDRVEQLKRMKTRNSGNYAKFLSRAFREMRYLEDLKESDPERYEKVSAERNLDRQVRDLARQYKRETDSSEKSRLEGEILTLLQQQFDFRQIHRNEEIDRLEKRLAELKANNQDRVDNKDEIIQRRVEQLLGDNRAFEW